MIEDILKSDDLVVGYKDNIIVDNVSFELKTGQVLCLLGPNGSGKSTIIKTLIDNIKKIDGFVTYNGLDIEKYKEKDRAKKISIVLTEKIAPEMMTGKEVVATGRYPYTNHFGKLEKEDLEIIDRSIEIVNAKELSEKEFKAMSDGEKQRIMIARAIAQQSDIMILDEPTSFLDIRYKIELLNILNKLAKEEGKIIIMSLHEIDLVSKIADKVLLIKKGQIYKYGPPEDVVTDDNIEYVYDLEKGSFNTNIGAIELLKMSNSENKTNVFVIGGLGQATKVYRALNRANISFNTGIIFENDVDVNAGKVLSEDIIIADAFINIDPYLIKKAKEHIDSSDIVIDTSKHYEGINKGNLELLDYAKENHKKIFFTEDTKIDEIIKKIKIYTNENKF